MDTEKENNKIPYLKLDLIFTIAQRDQGDKILKELKKDDILMNFICPGRGTATSSILEIMGLGATEKDVMLSIVPCDRTKEIINKICDFMNFSKPGTGICFSVPMQSIIGTNTLKLVSEGMKMKGGDNAG